MAGREFPLERCIEEMYNIKQRIEGKIDNKARYAIDRCIEEMYKDKPFGLYKFGYVEDLEKIDKNDLYNYYKELINSCKIDIFISGNSNEDKNELRKGKKRLKRGKCSIDMGEKNKNGRERQ